MLLLFFSRFSWFFRCAVLCCVLMGSNTIESGDQSRLYGAYFSLRDEPAKQAFRVDKCAYSLTFRILTACALAGAKNGRIRAQSKRTRIPTRNASWAIWERERERELFHPAPVSCCRVGGTVKWQVSAHTQTREAPEFMHVFTSVNQKLKHTRWSIGPFSRWHDLALIYISCHLSVFTAPSSAALNWGILQVALTFSAVAFCGLGLQEIAEVNQQPGTTRYWNPKPRQLDWSRRQVCVIQVCFRNVGSVFAVWTFVVERRSDALRYRRTPWTGIRLGGVFAFSLLPSHVSRREKGWPDGTFGKDCRVASVKDHSAKVFSDVWYMKRVNATQAVEVLLYSNVENHPPQSWLGMIFGAAMCWLRLKSSLQILRCNIGLYSEDTRRQNEHMWWLPQGRAV